MKRRIAPRITMAQLLLFMALCSISAAVYRTAMNSRLGRTPEIVALSPSGKTLISRSEAGLSVVDVMSSNARWRLMRSSEDGQAYQPKFVDESIAVFNFVGHAYPVEKIEIWDTLRRKKRHSIDLPIAHASFSISRSRRLLLVNNRRSAKPLQLVDIDSGKPAGAIPGTGVWGAQLSSDGQYVYVRSSRTAYQKWDLSDIENPRLVEAVPIRNTHAVHKRPRQDGVIQDGKRLTRVIYHGDTSLRFDTDGRLSRFRNDELIAASSPGLFGSDVALHPHRWAASEDMRTLVLLSKSNIRGREQFTLHVIDTDRMEVIRTIGQVMYVREVILFTLALIVCGVLWWFSSRRRRTGHAAIPGSLKVVWALLAVAAIWIIVVAQLQMFEILTNREIVQATWKGRFDEHLDYVDFWDNAAPAAAAGGVLMLMSVGHSQRRWTWLAVAILALSVLRIDIVAASLFMLILAVKTCAVIAGRAFVKPRPTENTVP